MDNANRIISFVLGLIVVIVVLLLITGRLGLFKGRNLFPISRGNTTTPTPTATKTAQKNDNKKSTPTPRRLAQNVVLTATPVVQITQTQKDSNTIKTIPSTGSSSELFAGIIAALIGGLFLRKIKVNA